jgi:tetratricopeptide (TPR) repeat protein
MKRFITLILLLMMGLPALSAGGTIMTYVIDPEKNAYEHNNLGLMYVEEKCYYAAIQEFKIAISLNPKTQATAVYFNNLGNVYMKIGYPDLALDCYKNALTQYSLNFEYYQNLVNCYKALGQTENQLARYKAKQNNPMDLIMLGLLYEQNKDKKKAIIVLDEFAMSEPDLIITPAVKNYIQKIIDEINNEDE